MIKKFVLVITALFLCNFGSAFLISDQGNSVRLTNGTLLDYGNLTISIYDSSSGGNLVFSSNVDGAIVNGSWNLMINPEIQYGQIYWKDYEINGEDLDFDGNDRLQFQSSSGLINNVSFFNFSIIGSCPTGSAIKVILFNGSVECESVIAGNSSFDLSNYALKNQSETFSGNITSSGGFFEFLGSFASRITSLFVKDIDASGNINADGNISADYILGDGSLLTNLPSAGSESDPIFVTENSTLWGAINSKLSLDDQRYNETALIISLNTTNNIMSLGFYNDSQVNSLISGINGGNNSFNQSLTDTLYYSIINPLNFINSSQISGYNQTSLILTTNSSLWSYISSNQAIWVSTFNSTYSSLVGTSCPFGYFVNGTLSNGTIVCSQISSQAESDPLWTANASSVLYVANLPLANKTIVHINNVTGFFYNYNQTSAANNYTNIVNSSIINWVDLLFARTANIFNKTEIQNQYYNKTEIIALGYANSSGLNSYNETSLINSINQTIHSLKLNVSDQRYNETSMIIGVNSSGNIQSLGFYNASQVNSLLSNAGNSSFNQSLTNALYYSISNPLNFINNTQASAYNNTLIILSVNSSLWNYISSNYAAWNSTFNSTYNNLLGQQCSNGLVVNGTLSNGTIICTSLSSTSGNIFNQNLNTTSNVTFANVTGSTGFFGFLGSLTNRISRIFVSDIDVSNNLTVSGNVSAQYYFGSLNKSIFPTSSCSGTDKVISISANGSVLCGTDQTSSGSTVPVKFMNVVAGAVTDTNAPATERIVGNSQYLVCTNTTGYDRFRYGFARSATNGATNAIIYMKYIVSPTSTITGSSYTNLSNSSAQILSYTVANSANLSAYYTMNNNLGDVCIGAFQAGGDGTLDPQWRNIWIELS